jgi:isocitrate lyase
MEDVERLRGSKHIKYTLAEDAATKLRDLLVSEKYVSALGAATGNQAIQMAKAGLKSIYLSGWQTAADANTAGQVYPDQSLYPANSGPDLARRINQALKRSDEIYHAEGDDSIDWYLPIVADAEAGFGGSLNVFELVKGFIEAGVAGIHLEDQLSSAKKCGHMGGKVLIPTKQAIANFLLLRNAATWAERFLFQPSKLLIIW